MEESTISTRSKTAYAFYELPDPVLSVLANTQTIKMLSKLDFDLSKYLYRSYSFFLKDFSDFVFSLNSKYGILKNSDVLKDLDITVFSEPWLNGFLEKCLEKKSNQSKVLALTDPKKVNYLQNN